MFWLLKDVLLTINSKQIQGNNKTTDLYERFNVKRNCGKLSYVNGNTVKGHTPFLKRAAMLFTRPVRVQAARQRVDITFNVMIITDAFGC